MIPELSDYKKYRREPVSALMVAINNSDVNHYSELINHGSVIDKEAVKKLLRRGDITLDTFKKIPDELIVNDTLFLIIENKNSPLDLIEYMIDNHVDVNNVDRDVFDELLERSVSVANLFLSKGIKYNIEVYLLDVFSQTALVKSAKSPKMFRVFTQFDRSRVSDNVSRSELVYALASIADNRQEKSLAIFLDHYKTIDFQGDKGETALIIKSRANQSKNAEVAIEFLLNHGAGINIMDNKGNTAISTQFSFRSGGDVINILLASGADVNLENNLGVTPLMNAINRDAERVVYSLLKAGANPDLINTEGGNIFHVLAFRPRFFLVAKELMRTCININALDDNGETALIKAVKVKNKRFIELLDSYSADLSVVNLKGESIHSLFSQQESEDKEYMSIMQNILLKEMVGGKLKEDDGMRL